MSTDRNKCPVCDENAKLLCTGCRDVKYCSEECQQSEWGTHRLLCKTFKRFQNRPSPEMRRIVVFRNIAMKPKFMWRAVQSINEGQEAVFEEFTRKTKDSYTISRNEFTQKPLSYVMIACSNAGLFAKYIKPKKKLTPNLKISMYVVAGYGTPDGILRSVTDMDMRTYSDFTAWQINNRESTLDTGFEFFHGPKVCAVKAHCIEDQRGENVPAFVELKIPSSHILLELKPTPKTISSISRSIGMPLKFLKYTFWKTKAISDTVNKPVTCMQINCDPDLKYNWGEVSSAFGYAPTYWQEKVGNVLIVREDRQPLDVDTMEAFGAYCQHHLGPYFAWLRAAEVDVANASEEEVLDGLNHPSREKEEYDVRTQIVLDEIDPAKWATYLEQWKYNKKQKAATSAEEEGGSVTGALINGVARMALSEKDAARLMDRLFCVDDAENVEDEAEV